MAECQRKANNGRCDPECDRFACGFDAGECLYSTQSSAIPLTPYDSKLIKALPWANCTAIQEEGIPCHLRFSDGKCDPECDSEACLFDGWDCRDEPVQVYDGFFHLFYSTFSKLGINLLYAFAFQTHGGRILTRLHSITEPKKPVEGSLILLFAVPPSQLLPENEEKRDLERQILDGLRALLRVSLRIRKQPKTGAPMVYPVPLATTQITTSRIGSRKGPLWFLHETSSGVNVSISRFIIDQEMRGGSSSNAVAKLSDLLTQLTKIMSSSAKSIGSVTRRRRETLETRIGSRVFFEVQNAGCQPFGRCLMNDVNEMRTLIMYKCN